MSKFKEFKEIKVEVPQYDCDVIIVFPGGKKLTIQLRPGNADVNYNGSLDIILPENQLVTSWEGEDMEDSKAPDPKYQNQRVCQQLVCELPGQYAGEGFVFDENENEFELDNGGVMEWDNGTIRYRDQFGNCEGVWEPGEAEYDRYKADYFPNHVIVDE